MVSIITIKNEPPAQAPVYNMLEFCVDETGTPAGGSISLLTNYKYIFTYTITNTVSTYTQKFYVSPIPADYPGTTSSYFGFHDASIFIDSYLREEYVVIELAQSANGMYKGETDFIVEYSVNVKSGWNVSGTFTEDPDATGGTTSSTLYAWCGSFDHESWINQMRQGSPFNTWICNSTNGTAAKFLTAAPTRKAELTQTGWTYYMTDSLTDIDQMEIITYSGEDASGSVVGTFVVDYVDGQTEIEERLARVSSAPISLNNIPGAQISTGSQPIIPSTGVASYTIQLQTSAGAACSEVLVYNIVEPCRYETHRIHFWNKLGGFDQYNFTSLSKKSSKIERKSLTINMPRFDSSTGLVYTQQDNGTQDYLVKDRDRIKLRSEYLTEEEVIWLKELKTSPQVYMEFTPDEEPVLRRVYVVDGSWEQFYEPEEKLYQIEVTIEFSHQNIRQRK